ncbi:MAG: penicillin-binding protein 2 [Acidobacteriota bacterium]|nr:penicillin-binding protein 2 [Acidobacteriota bacterium]
MPIYQDNSLCWLRLKWIQRLLVVLFLGLFLKLWHLTVVDFTQHSVAAERNRARNIPIRAPRGVIYDREGRVLASSANSFSLVCYRSEASDLEATVDYLVQGLGLDRKRLEQRFAEADGYSPYQPLVVKRSLTMAEVAYLLSRKGEHPELDILSELRRSYPHGELAAHVLGYVGEASRGQLETTEFSDFKAGDIVGKYAVERVYNRHLAGRNGTRKILVDSLGRTIDELGQVPPEEGAALELTLDLDLQMTAEEQLGGRRGVVVAFDPRNGEILAMVSQPAFDPNRFAARISRSEWDRLVGDEHHPLQNRALQSTFAPGSVFKLVVALAGLEWGDVDPNRPHVCGGGVTLYGHHFRCWKKEGHGPVSLREAIRSSCNVYFYQLGKTLGIDLISGFGQAIGLDRPTGIDLVGEVAGLVPSKEWKRRTFREKWYRGETVSVSIGQGPVHLTPLQLARMVGILATGSAAPLHLARDQVPRRRPARNASAVEISSDNLDLLREAMWEVVNRYGTGRAAQVNGFDVCGKTGTAQTIGQAGLSKLDEAQASRFTANAWFVGFAPQKFPEVAVVVLVEAGGSGGAVAAPIAAKVLQVFHDKRRPDRVREMARQ